MAGCGAFVLRYFGFMLAIGSAAWIALQEWSGYGLDGLVPSGDAPGAGLIALGRLLFYAIVFAGPALAALAEGIIRRAGVFIAAALIGILITAPFALARSLG